MKLKSLLLSVIPALLLLNSVCALSNCVEGLDSKIQQLMDEGAKANNIIGMQFSVLCKDESIPHDYATGATTINGDVPVTPQTLFIMGSITKSYTAALILQLEAQGLLSIDDNIGVWLPQIPKKWQKITIRQLLNMTSGIPEYIDNKDFRAALFTDYERQWQPSELFAFVAKKPLKFKPGNGYSYSSTNYLLAGMIIDSAAAAYGKSYADLIKTNIFEPLGLTNTYYWPNSYDEKILAQLAHYYLRVPRTTDNIDLTIVNISFANSAGANLSSAHDTAIWIHNLMHGNILAEKQMTELQTMVDMFTGQPTDSYGYGLGVYQENVHQELSWQHRGAIMGTVNVMNWFPCRDMAFAYTSTVQPGSEDGAAETIAKQIMALIQEADPRPECKTTQRASVSLARNY